MFAEIVYETGRMSVGEYATEDELKSALKAHHSRAVAGEPGGPVGQPAERISAVYIYANHPDDYNVEQTMSADVLKSELDALVTKSADKNGVVALDQLVFGVRGIAHPMVDNDERTKAFDSYYKTKEDKKLNLSFLDSATGGSN